jgi:general secretion pathway protein D
MLKIKSRSCRNRLMLLLISTILAACAGQRLHSSGVSLIQDGHIEEGLAKLEQASKEEPDNVSFRSDWLRNRMQVENHLLANASNERALGHMDSAQAIYERILKIDPDNPSARLAIEAMNMDRRHASQVEAARKLFAKGDMDGTRSLLKPILIENPRQGDAITLLRQIDEKETKQQMVEPSLTGKFKKPVSLQFRDANVKMVFEAIARISGINVLLDKDVKADIKTSIFVKDVSVEDAIDLILMQAQLEKKILSDNTVFVYPNTAAKKTEFQDLKVRSFHLTNADPKQMLTMIKTLLKTKDIFIHEKTNSLIMRDTPDAIHLAEKLISDQDVADPEVMLEVEVLEISRARLSDIGIQFPNQMSFSPIQSLVNAPGPTGITAPQLTLDSLRNINSSNISVSPAPTVTLNAMLQDSDTNILSSPRLRVRNREKAKIMIGERVPMITNSVTPTNTGTPVVTGTVTYQDVGLKLEVEPEIHLDNEISIKIGLEVSSLGLAVNNSSGSQVFRVGTRNTSTALRLKDGETQILGGLITDEDRSTVDKVPALGQIPLLGHLFSSDNGNKTKTEIILSITPHIVGTVKNPDAREMEYWSGTEASLRSNQLLLRPIGAVSMGNSSATTPGVFSQPSVSPALVNNSATPVTQGVAVLKPSMSLPLANASDSGSVSNKESSESKPIVISWRGPKLTKVGSKFTLSLSTSQIQGVSALGFQIGFDPAVLKPIDVVDGKAFRSNNSDTNFSKNIDLAGGNITVEVKGESGSGISNLVMMSFEAISAVSETPITVSSITASSVSGETLPVTPIEPHVIAIKQ